MSLEGANNTLEYWSVDDAGNEEPHKFLNEIKLDKSAPSITVRIGSTTEKGINICRCPEWKTNLKMKGRAPELGV
ncbi:MAG: hypothetical protein QXD53_04405 [Candidatus Bathyarchaeia archaeon]